MIACKIYEFSFRRQRFMIGTVKQERVMDKETLLIIVFTGIARHCKTKGINKSNAKRVIIPDSRKTCNEFSIEVNL